MGNNEGKEPKVKVEVAQPSIELIITMFPNGQINVHGPIHDKILCYGLLQVARDIVRDYKQQQVVVPQLIMPSNLKGGQG